MRVRCFAILGAFLLAGTATPHRCRAQAPPAPAESKADNRLTAERAITLRFLSNPQFSPDGARVALTVTEPPKESGSRQHIWMLDVEPGELRRFTDSPKSENSPRWSPDGRKLAFLSDREEFRQIYMMPTDGGEALPLTEGKRSVSAFEWSPDGKQIAFLAPEPKSEAEEKKEKDKDDARVVDRDDKHARLWVIDVESRKVRQLTSGPWSVSEFRWVSQGDRFIVSATDHPESDLNTNRIFPVDAADGKMREIAAPRGPFGNLRVSPDGRWLTFLAAREEGPTPHDLFIVSTSGGVPRNLTGSSLDRPIGAYLWRPDGTLVALVHTGFKTALYSISTDGKTKPLASISVNPTSFDVSVSGLLAFVGQAATQPQELWLKDAGGNARRVSRLNEKWNEYALACPEIIRYKSFDGLEIEAALLKPPGYDASAKLPLVVLVHGGPTGAWSDSIELWGQLLAARGFAVLYPNIRGSTGYGQRFIELNRGDWGGGDYRDVMAGVDFLIARGIADPDRLGIGGWSYGGYMSEWAITQTRRFKAAVSGAGMANLVSEFGTERGSAYDEWFYGVPYERMEGFLKSSPITYMKNARTPTLILQGMADLTDPLGQSQELYRGLKRYGVESDFVVYPREGHGLTEEKHLLDRLNRIVAWFDAHMK